MREHFLGLVEQSVQAVDPDPKRFIAAIERIAQAIRSGTNPLADGGLMGLVATPEQKLVLDQISGLMSLLEGHGDVTMNRAGQGLIPAAERFERVLHQRRQSAQGIAKLLQQLIGLEAKINQYEQGERFIGAVESAGGVELLNRAWEDPENLPSIAEIREPSSWISRMQLAPVS